MKKVFVCYANYTGEKKEFFDTLTENNFREYCVRNNIEFYMIKDRSKHSIDRHPTWMSWKIIDDLIDSGYLVDGDKVFSLDADTCIVDMNADLTSKKSFSYAIDSCNTHCMGFYTISIDDWSKKLVKNVLNEDMYARLKDAPIWKMWNDQAGVYELFGIKRHSWEPFALLENQGWHSAVSPDTKYEIADLIEHVEILPTEYNVTHVAGEGFNEYFINPTQGKDTIIRHFAGGPSWDAKYFSEVKR
jgi:hypothetical protein